MPAIVRRLVAFVLPVLLAACVSAGMPPANPALRISKITVDMGPYLANEGGSAPVIAAELSKQAASRFAKYMGTPSDPVLTIQIKTVDLASGLGRTRGGRGNGTDAMQGAVILQKGASKIVYPMTAEIQADDVIEPQAIVADFLGWTEKYVFGR